LILPFLSVKAVLLDPFVLFGMPMRAPVPIIGIINYVFNDAAFALTFAG
jgi:hypothetical protein